MKQNQSVSKPSLKDIKNSLAVNQQITPEMQCNVKGGCSNCEDNRRPPRVSSSSNRGN